MAPLSSPDEPRADHDKPRAHFLHVGKCGGTAINTALEPVLDAGRYAIVLDGHDVDLRQIPPGEKFFFVVRDPLERYVSSFNDRQRCSRPRYDVGWTLEEERAYARFHTPDELGRALSSPDAELRGAAHEAITTIYHVRHSYWHWFVDPELFAARRVDLLYAMWLPSLRSSFARVCELLGVDGVELPSDDLGAHRQAPGADTHLSDEAGANLKRWYRRDYEFIELCARLDQAAPELRAQAGGRLQRSGLRLAFRAVARRSRRLHTKPAR